MWSSAYCFEVIVHQILAELCPFENFSWLFFSGYFLLQFTSDQAESYAPLKISVNFSFPAKSSYSLHPIKLKFYL